MSMTLKEKLATINKIRKHLSGSERKTLGSFKQMCRNLKEEGGRIGGESHIAPNGLKHANQWADNMIAVYAQNFTA